MLFLESTRNPVLRTRITVGIHVEQSGLWLSASGVLGASPDGLVRTSAVVEFKCPYKHRNATIEEAVQDASFYLEKKGPLYNHNSTFPNWHQMQGQLHIQYGDGICVFSLCGPQKLHCHAHQKGRGISISIEHLSVAELL